MLSLTAAWPDPASLGSSLDAFFNAVDSFFSNLAAVQWGALAVALLFQLGHVLCRSRAWFNTLRAAYPNEPFQWRRIAGSYVAGVGVNSILPARAGDVTKIYLAKQSVPNSTYPAVTSSFFVDSVFDTPVGVLVLTFAIAHGGAAEPQPAAEPARVRPRLLGGPSALRPLRDHVGDARAAGPVRGAVGARGGVLEPDQAGCRDPHGLPALPAAGRQLDGRRMAVAVRLLLLLPGGVQHRRLGPERAARDERAGALHAHAVHARRRGRPAGAAGLRLPGRRPAGAPCSPTASASRSRWRLST